MIRLMEEENVKETLLKRACMFLGLNLARHEGSLSKIYDDKGREMQESDMRREELTEHEAEKVMRHWLKKSGFESWTLYKGYILFRKRGCPPVHVMSWNNVRFYPGDEIMFRKKEHVTCREVVQRCLDKCMKGLYIYVIDSKQTENIDLLKPFQSLEELMVEIDLSCSAGDALDSMG